MDNELKMLTLREAADVLGVSHTKLREVVAAGEIQTMRWGKQVRIPAWSLRKWQEHSLNLARELVTNLIG